MTLGVVCWKWKPKAGYRSHFGPETVNILKQMVKRNYPHPHNFICVTDDPKGIDPDIKIVPLWDQYGDLVNPHGDMGPSCYRRLKMFSPEAKALFGERFVSMDLDTVIVDDLSPIWNRPEDCVFWGDTNPGTHYNGSMMLLTAGARPQVWSDFNPEKSPMLSKAAGQFGSDQGWISYCLGPSEAKWTIADGVYSYRMHLRHRPRHDLPRGARIVMFHGHTDPWAPPASNIPWVRKYWRYNEYAKDGIEAINLPKRLALFTSGRFEPIIAFYDEDGEETNGPQTAVSFVCGHDDQFWAGLISHFRKTLVH